MCYDGTVLMAEVLGHGNAAKNKLFKYSLTNFRHQVSCDARTHYTRARQEGGRKVEEGEEKSNFHNPAVPCPALGHTICTAADAIQSVTRSPMSARPRLIECGTAAAFLEEVSDSLVVAPLLHAREESVVELPVDLVELRHFEEDGFYLGHAQIKSAVLLMVMTHHSDIIKPSANRILCGL
ncbi:hypothetical protein EYF80_019050 [Liparis tanakae]|uniref:Uncharacterized protein n=1 Tax=Liparis tanakae TaxID=230148 RepID=A0A4Z2HYH4_9TELE|nr:hypothetical protein EYF80_019050 [Liparis tanakae]